MNDGGLAFPQQWAQLLVKDDVFFLDRGGMSLRDYFAAAALSCLLEGRSIETIQRDTKDSTATELIFARCAYRYADAMIQARSNAK
jgi:hypothetical protein